MYMCNGTSYDDVRINILSKYIPLCTLYTVQCTVYIVQCTLNLYNNNHNNKPLFKGKNNILADPVCNGIPENYLCLSIVVLFLFPYIG